MEAYGAGNKIMKAYESLIEKPLNETPQNAFKIRLPNINAKKRNRKGYRTESRMNHKFCWG